MIIPALSHIRKGRRWLELSCLEFKVYVLCSIIIIRLLLGTVRCSLCTGTVPCVYSPITSVSVSYPKHCDREAHTSSTLTMRCSSSFFYIMFWNMRCQWTEDCFLYFMSNTCTIWHMIPLGNLAADINQTCNTDNTGTAGLLTPLIRQHSEYCFTLPSADHTTTWA